MNTQPSNPEYLLHDQGLQSRRRLRRILAWSIFYLLLLAVFGYNIYHNIMSVNTKIIPSGRIDLTASQLQYTVGNKIQVTLKNGLTSSITLNGKCPQEPLNVYRWENNLWTRVHSTVDAKACAAQSKQTVIPPNGTYNISYADWSQLFATPGIYRIAALADNYNGVAYTDFDVVAPPAPVAAPTIQTVYQTVYTPIYIQTPAPPAPTSSSYSGGGDD